MRCEQCQTTAAEHHRFCSNCGSALIGDPPVPEPGPSAYMGMDGWSDAEQQAFGSSEPDTPPSVDVEVAPSPAPGEYIQASGIASTESPTPGDPPPADPAPAEDLPWYLQGAAPAGTGTRDEETLALDEASGAPLKAASTVPAMGDWGDTSQAPLPWFKRGRVDAAAEAASPAENEEASTTAALPEALPRPVTAREQVPPPVPVPAVSLEPPALARRAAARPPRPVPVVKPAMRSWARTAVLGGVLVIVGVLGAPLLQPWWSPPAPAYDPLADLPPEAFGPPKGPLPAQPVVPTSAQATIVPPATTRPTTDVQPPQPAPIATKPAAKVATAARKPPAARAATPPSDAKREPAPAPLAATSLRAEPTTHASAVSSTPAPMPPAGPTFEVTQVDVRPQIERTVPARYPAGVREPAPDVVVWDPLESTCRHASLSIL